MGYKHSLVQACGGIGIDNGFRLYENDTRDF